MSKKKECVDARIALIKWLHENGLPPGASTILLSKLNEIQRVLKRVSDADRAAGK